MLKKMLRKWLHEAALAAEVFTGQAHWRAFEERARQTAPKQAQASAADHDFVPVLRAAD
ncbi:hypothetical protein [Parvibaculum lavamentivorans]|uniref:hypothetical protein n=1 Tax=Parvibaculum lavamentivorans TaxID=256618 RepID=UPI0002DB8C42|nr:hypothetical protein [Parvibaculum lavamentivorans]